MSMATRALFEFDDSYARELPSLSMPWRVTPVPAPSLLVLNGELAEELAVDADLLRESAGVALLAGNAAPDGVSPVAQAYSGHQFGGYVPRLGDGRALLLGELVDRQGHRHDLHLKGSGATPFARGGDGKAAIGPMLREYLMGEAMHALGIPTTRALSLVGSPQPVRRETVETAAVVCRAAPGFIRFGHFEYFYYQNRHDALKPLADHVIAEHFPQFTEHADRYQLWLTEVVERTARLMAQWQAVGFCHGVMNTDNFSALGLTLDYGPYGFMDAFDAHHICNHTDEGGRYAYDQQPMIGHWNCSRLLQATLPLLSDQPEQAVEIANAILERYPPAYTQAMTPMWIAKLGLRDLRLDDPELVNRFLSILHKGHSDFSRSFRHLARLRTDTDEPAHGVRDEIADLEAFDAWVVDYRARLRSESSDDAERATRMNAVNPKYMLRNHLVQTAIEQAQGGSYEEIDTLFKLVNRPFDEQPEMERYAEEPPASARHIEVSCSS